MTASEIILAGERQNARPWPRHTLTQAAWREMAAALADEPTLALLALWADSAAIYALFLDETSGAILPVSTALDDGAYPALSPTRPVAAWMERMVHDLWARTATGGTDARPWLDHGRWGVIAPLSPRPTPFNTNPDPPDFLPAEGEDLHQIAVGPVHAGIIEPGHFRFHAAGETIVRLEARLGYTHKGTLSLMRGKSPRAAIRFAARLSGDATVAHSIAFARAAEAAVDSPAPPRAAALRAVMAELERLANHLGDVGAICNDASFGFALARFCLHREAMLAAAAAAFGHRLMMDCVIPGGVAADITQPGPDAILRALDALEAELPGLLRVYDDTTSLVDRMAGTGTLTSAMASLFAAGGPVGRASGRPFDARRIPGYPPYDDLDVAVPVLRAGDVDARVRIRLLEITESIRLLRALLINLPESPIVATQPMATGEGIGVAETCRGDAWHWMRLDGGLIAACFMRDPSWALWPALEAAVEGNIVADFPLANRSFNASYSGVDL
jgi:Ni,Fe-hydrogenase III large subunit/Ni,Fe-hydrogenase III component G